MDFDLHKLFSPGPARIPDAAGRELIAQPPCGADSLLPNYCPKWGLGGCWSGHLMPGSLFPSHPSPSLWLPPVPSPCQAVMLPVATVTLWDAGQISQQFVCQSNTFKSTKCPSLFNDRICFAFTATMKLLL